MFVKHAGVPGWPITARKWKNNGNWADRMWRIIQVRKSGWLYTQGAGRENMTS